MLFLRRGPESEARILALLGMALAMCLTVVVVVVVVADPLDRRPQDQLGIIIETPYAGQGVKAGTALLMHGAQVGEVTQVTSLPDGGIRLAAELQRGPSTGLTDTMGIDFRPANYFGVTGINVQPGEGGQPLHDASLIKATPSGNFTLQALLSRANAISHTVLTPKVIDVIDRATRYTDGLEPLLETILIMSDSLANVQTVSTAQLLTNATGISVAFPGFAQSVTQLGDDVINAGGLDTVSQDYYDKIFTGSLDLVANNLFGAVGKLVGSHSTELAPFIDLVKAFTDIVPGLVPPDDVADTAKELRRRLERLFTGPPDRRAVNVRVILDSLPGIAAPIAAVGGTP